MCPQHSLDKPRYRETMALIMFIQGNLEKKRLHWFKTLVTSCKSYIKASINCRTTRPEAYCCNLTSFSLWQQVKTELTDFLCTCECLCPVKMPIAIFFKNKTRCLHLGQVTIVPDQINLTVTIIIITIKCLQHQNHDQDKH